MSSSNSPASSGIVIAFCTDSLNVTVPIKKSKFADEDAE
jgi:hypothetical protein